MELASQRDALIERIREQIFLDDRVIAAWLHGSIGRGIDDDWSDVDLVLLIEDEHHSEFWTGRQTLFDAIGRQVFLQPPIPENSIIPGGNFQLVIFSGPVEIDWTIAPASNAQRARDTHLLFERRPIPILENPIVGGDDAFFHHKLQFFWAMAPIAVKYAARDDMLRVAGMISVLRDTLQVFDPAIVQEKLERLSRPIALAEIQRLCGEAVRLDRDRRYFGIAEAVNQLMVAAG
jgi:predicted nucleotidyltransferase